MTRLMFWKRPEPSRAPIVWPNFAAMIAARITEFVTPSRESGATLSPAQFVVAIGQHLVSAHAGHLPKVSDTASQCLRDFLRDEHIKFGDGRYTWDYEAAGEIARCYGIEFWDEV